MLYVRPARALHFKSTRTYIIQKRRSLRDNARFTRPSTSALAPQPQPTVTDSDGTKTLRLRQHGNRSLPLPPLMDPIAIEAKERYKKPKAEPNSGEQVMSDFQRELAANPYGMITQLM